LRSHAVTAIASSATGFVFGAAIVLVIVASNVASRKPIVDGLRFGSWGHSSIFIGPSGIGRFRPIVGNWFSWVRAHDRYVIGYVPDAGADETPMTEPYSLVLLQSGYFFLDADRSVYKIGLNRTQLEDELNDRSLSILDLEWVPVPIIDSPDASRNR